MAGTPGVSASHSPTAHQGSGPSRKAAAVFLLRHHQGMLSPSPGKAFKTGIVAVPVHIQRQAVCCRREDGRAAVNAVGGERPLRDRA